MQGEQSSGHVVVYSGLSMPKRIGSSQEGAGRRATPLPRSILRHERSTRGRPREVRTFARRAVEAAVFIGSEGVGRREIAMIT